MQLGQLHLTFLNEMKLLYDDHEAAVITSMVFESLLGIDKSALIKNGKEAINAEWEAATTTALVQLRQHVPVQYVTGIAWFCDLPFKVNNSVLIPRPETEELVNKVVAFCQTGSPKKLIDIGTGSGCIAISIQKHLPELSVSAIDVSPKALAVAKENAETHEVNIDWHEVNFLHKDSWGSLGTYDVIVSNPPYIPASEIEMMDKNVTAYEPHLALFVPDKAPLIFYQNIALFGKQQLAAGGKIFMETHEKYAGQVAALFCGEGYLAVVEKDFYEKDRMVVATRSHLL